VERHAAVAGRDVREGPRRRLSPYRRTPEALRAFWIHPPHVGDPTPAGPARSEIGVLDDSELHSPTTWQCHNAGLMDASRRKHKASE
jgi:hypothetical protein